MLKKFLRFVLPSMVAFAFTGLYSIVDGFFRGQQRGRRRACRHQRGVSPRSVHQRRRHGHRHGRLRHAVHRPRTRRRARRKEVSGLHAHLSSCCKRRSHRAACSCCKRRSHRAACGHTSLSHRRPSARRGGSTPTPTIISSCWRVSPHRRSSPRDACLFCATSARPSAPCSRCRRALSPI